MFFHLLLTSAKLQSILSLFIIGLLTNLVYQPNLLFKVLVNHVAFGCDRDEDNEFSDELNQEHIRLQTRIIVWETKNKSLS
jgi:hypothetical protein